MGLRKPRTRRSWPFVMPPSRPPARLSPRKKRRSSLIVMNRVLHFRTEAFGALLRPADFHAFDGLHGNDGLGELAVEAGIPRDMRPETRGQAVGHYFKDSADRVAGSVNFVDHQLHFLFGGGIDAAEEDFGAAAQLDEFVPFDGAFEAAGADGDHVAQDFNAEMAQKLLDNGADGDTRGGFAGAGAFKDVAGVGQIVLNGAGEIGMAGAGARNRLVLRGIAASTGMDSVQFFQSALAMIMAMGEPMVRP